MSTIYRFISQPLRVLVIEDSVNDTFFIIRELQRGGYNVSFERVESQTGMQDALEAHPWDLVISDYSMPQFSGAGALALFQRRRLDIPFIMVSGALGEERIVEVLKAGAHDYVMKNALGGLVPAVRRELEAAHERRTRRQSEAALSYLASIVQSCTDAIIGETLEGTVVSWNRGAERLYGYSAVEMIGRPSTSLVPPENREEWYWLLARVEQGRYLDQLETARLQKDGRRVQVSVRVSPIRDSGGRMIGRSTVSRESIGQQRKDRRDVREPLAASMPSAP